MEEKQPNTRQEYNRETGNSRTSFLTLSDPSLAPVGPCLDKDRKLIDTTIPIAEQLDNLYQLIRSTLFTYLVLSATFSVARKVISQYHLLEDSVAGPFRHPEDSFLRTGFSKWRQVRTQPVFLNPAAIPLMVAASA